MSELNISPDAAQLMVDTATQIRQLSAAAIAECGAFHWALSGGSTPKALFELIATPTWAAQFDWANIHLWWGDERDVPADSPDSNYKLAHDALIGNVPIPASNVHRIQTELGPDQAALAYEQAIRDTLLTASSPHPLTSSSAIPQLDLILLGMGDDGHTASLFPGTAAIFETTRLVVAHFVTKVNMMRITVTPPLINAAHVVMFLVSGAGKAEMLRRVLYEIDQPKVLPSQIVSPASGELWWMVDAPAAAKLNETDGLGEGSLEDIYRQLPKN